MQEELKKIQDLVQKESQFVQPLWDEMQKVIVGQAYILERLMIGLLTEGHLLLEGVPGLAKTLSVQTLSQATNIDFKRIQFTPDLLPADLLGTLIYDQHKKTFEPKLGPIFSNIILADEINRAPAKVQSALLECMQEKQVTLGDTTYKLTSPFLVLATQNPIDQEGTYSLPEAQVDRFLMKLKITYPEKSEEKEIINRMTQATTPSVNKILDAQTIISAGKVVKQIYTDDKVKDYVLDLVFATRNPEKYGLSDLVPYIEYPASPRASIGLITAAKAHAFLQGRGFVTPEDIKAIGKDVLRHRITPTFEAEAEEVTAEDIIDKIFAEIEVP